MPETNIFSKALIILARKNERQMTEAEAKLMATATIPLHLLPAFTDMDIKKGLEYLAQLVEEPNDRTQGKDRGTEEKDRDGLPSVSAHEPANPHLQCQR
jgi:hypothetical protein